jgi:hypothetical protein
VDTTVRNPGGQPVGLLRQIRRLPVTNFGESPKGEVRRIPIPRTPVNKGKKKVRMPPALRGPALSYVRLSHKPESVRLPSMALGARRRWSSGR